MRDAIHAVMDADGVLTTLLTGGMYAGGTITRQETPAAYDANKELQPCALVREENATAWGAMEKDDAISTRVYVLVIFYQHRGHDVIEQALDRARVILHDNKLGGTVFRVEWAGDARDLTDPGLECSMVRSRYVVTKWR